MALFKFTVLYRRVEDEDTLELFFSGTHLQLVEQLPGLVKTEVARVTGKPGGESRFHLSYSAYFANAQAFEMALLSEPGRQLMAALKPWADAKAITWFYAEAFEEAARERVVNDDK